MRIALISNALPQALGGAGTIVGVYVKTLEAQGHEVKIWGPRPEFSTLGQTNALKRLLFHVRDLAANWPTVEQVLGWKPDALITHNLTGCGFGTPQAIQKAGVRWIHVLHDVQLFEPSGQVVEGETFKALRSIWRIFWAGRRQAYFGTPNLAISPTKWLLEQHLQRGFFKTASVRIVPNPIDPNSEPSQIKVLGSCLYVGRLDSDKGIDLLLAAWSQIDRPRKSLTIVGSGTWSDKIRQLKDATIIFKGAMPNNEVRSLFAQSEVAIVPSRVWENQPTVILEAMQAKAKVVAARVGGIGETLGEAGWICEPDSVQALSAAIQAALDSKADAVRQAAAQEILKLHDPEVFAAGLAGLLKSNL